MRISVPVWLSIVLSLIITACSSDHSANPAPTQPPPPAAAIVVSGAVVDGPLTGATVSAYAVSSAGVVGTTALATATTGANGSYSLNLPAGTTGAVELVSTGGTYTDDVTGATMLPGPTLKALLPTVTAASSPLAAQLTPFTTIAAQLALATASSTNPIATVAAAINTAVGGYFGGQTDLVATPIVDVSTANCAANASAASTDATLLIAAISQLASAQQPAVSTADLIQALVVDAQSDGNFDGTAAGTPLTVPLTGGTVMLCTIENNCAGSTGASLAKNLGLKVAAFASSSANVCGLTESAAAAAALGNSSGGQIFQGGASAASTYSYTLNSSVSGDTGGAPVTVGLQVGLSCSDDTGGGGPNPNQLSTSVVTGNTASLALQVLYNGPITETSGGSTTIIGPNTASNDCGTNTWKLVVLQSPPGLACSVVSPSTGTFPTTGNGDVNTAMAPMIACSSSTPVLTVSATVSGLTGTGLVLQDNGGDNLPVSADGTYVFPTSLAAGATYAVTVSMQPTGETCSAAPSGSGAGTVGTLPVVVTVNCSPGVSGTPGAETVYVIDSTYTLFAFDTQGNSLGSVKLPGQPASVGNYNGGGITVDANNVYVTLGAPSTGVAAFNRTTLQPVTLASGAFANVSTPRAIVFDPANSQFYVANGASTVTMYNAAGGYLGNFSSAGNGIYGPSGIAYDPTDNAIWVANNTGGTDYPNPIYGIAEFDPSGTLIHNYPTGISNPPTPFAPPVNTSHELPYTISYCGSSLSVGFISDVSNTGKSEAGDYTISGAAVGPAYSGVLGNLHATACAQNGNVYAADDNGLFEFNNQTGASVALPPGGFSGLTKPIFGVGIAPPVGLDSPEGLVYSKGSLYVANSGSNQVLVYSVSTNATTGVVTGMTLSGAISADINDPVRLAIDTAGHLFVANLGNNSVSVYDTTSANTEITAAGKPLISGGSLSRPLGVAVDSAGDVYVANNGGNSISVFQPVTSGSISAGFKEAAFSPLSADAAANPFSAPGVLLDVNLLGQDYLLVGLGPTTGADNIYLYKAPFTQAPTPIFDLSSAACSSAPTGPTGIALFTDTSNPLNSQIFVTSYYNSNVTEYLASSLVGSTNLCPAPNSVTSTAGLVNGPEGVAVDPSGTNVFVSNAESNTITVYGSGSNLSGAPIFTLSN